MKVRVFSDSTLCVGVSNPDPSNNWSTKFVEQLNLTAPQVQFIWHVLPGASTVDTKEHSQNHLNGKNPNHFDERIIFMSMFNKV